MTDIVDKQTRSKMMSAVRAKNTKLETDIRRRLFALGFRYRLHTRNLPGTPDIVFPKYSTVIFVNGCFWHYHGCSRSSIPDSRRNWWCKKLEDNRTRDAKALAELRSNGWRVVVIWECSVRRPGIDRKKALDRVCIRVGKFLRSKRNSLEISGPMPELASEKQVKGMKKKAQHSIPLIRVYDFFSGCGGTSVGFRQAGIHPALAIDSCKDAVGTFQKNFPGTSVINEPIETVDIQRVESYYSNESEIKLFCGCAPCQPFTKQKTNTKKKSSKDNRRDLLTHFSAIVHECLPELVFVENVPGLQKVFIEGGSPFSLFIKQLEKDGYFVDYGVISAQDYGTPQIRRRLVLVASHLGNISLPAPTHGPNLTKAHVTVGDEISDFPPVEHGTEHPDKRKYPNHRAARLSPLNLKRIKHTGANGRRDWPESLLPECYTEKKNGERYKGHSDCYTRLAWGKPAPGLTTRCISYSNGRFGHPEQDRAITVREAARLQGFPNSFVFIGSLSSMARQIGNAVPVQVARAFGRHFIKHVKSVEHCNG